MSVGFIPSAKSLSRLQYWAGTLLCLHCGLGLGFDWT